MFTHNIGDVSERPWGRWEIIAQGDKYQIKRITINPGQRLSLQSHEYRFETWLVTSGRIKMELDGQISEHGFGDVVRINIGQKHRPQCISSEPAILIEIQQGEYVGEDDICRYEDDYGRNHNH